MNAEDNLSNVSNRPVMFVCGSRFKCSRTFCAHYNPHKFESRSSTCEEMYCHRVGEFVKCVEHDETRR